MKKNFDIIVIGSGLGGLTAASELASAGKKVLVLEQHFRVGGSATSFKRKDFIYEAGLHMTAEIKEGHGHFDLLKNCELGKKIKYIKVPEFYHVIGSDYNYTFSNDIKDNIKRLSEMFPDEAKAIKQYFDSIITIHDQTMIINEKKGINRLLAFIISPFKYPKVLNGLFSSVGKFLDRLFKDERLKAIMLGNMGYYGDDPYKISLIFYAIAQKGFYNGEGSYIQGGSHKLPDAIADNIIKFNGTILTMQNVTKIITENGEAVGVEYVSKRKDATVSQAFAPVIIANTAIPNVIEELLDEKTAKPLKKQYGKFSIAPSIMTVYVALDKPLKEMGNDSYSLVFYKKKDLRIRDFAEYYHADFNIRPFILCDYSQMDTGLAPEGKGYLVLSLMDYLEDWEGLSESEYKYKKKKVGDILVHRVCEQFPDMCDHIERVELATARTMKRFLQTPGGTAYGYTNSPRQSLIFRPAVKSQVPNLYFASAWAIPGGGFGGAITSGQMCADAIKKDLGIN